MQTRTAATPAACLTSSLPLHAEVDRLEGVGCFGRNPSCAVPNNRAVTIPAAPAANYRAERPTPPLPLGTRPRSRPAAAPTRLHFVRASGRRVNSAAFAPTSDCESAFERTSSPGQIAAWVATSRFVSQLAVV